MSYPSEEEILAVADPPTWIDKHFLRQDPYAFGGSTFTFQDAACEISASLDVERNGIFCIGSGAIGYSLSPDKVAHHHLKRFDDASDLDLAIISSHHFETAWRELLYATQPHLQEVPYDVKSNLAWQKKRLFDGAILSNKLLASFSFGPKWSSAIDQLSGHIADSLDRNIKVDIWIYRNYWSLRNYIARGVVECQKQIKKQSLSHE